MIESTVIIRQPDLYLAYREKTKCKQYFFYSFSDMYAFFNKKCYKGESIKYSGHRSANKNGTKFHRPFIEGELFYVNA